MRKSPFLALLIVGAAALLILPAITTGQFQIGGKGGKGGKGAMRDPAALFDMLAGTRGYIVIAEQQKMKDTLTQFAQSKGITNGQISRQQFADFQDYLKDRLVKRTPPTDNQASGATQMQLPPGGFGAFGGGFGGKGGGKKGGGFGLAPGTAIDPEAINDFADRDFKRADANGDGKLHKDEMPAQLLATLSRWDENNDHFIDQAEFRKYYAARIGDDGNVNRAIATIIIEDDELDRKPIVYRANNLPSNLPPWFKDLDTDNDGQVALLEWHAGKKALEEFPNWDLNDDGYIIPEEALRIQGILARNTRGGNGDEGSGFGGGAGFGGGKKKGNFGGGGENPFGYGGGKQGDYGAFGGGKKKGYGGGDASEYGGGFGGGKKGGKGKKGQRDN